MIEKVVSSVLLISCFVQLVNCEYDVKIHRQGESVALQCSTDTKWFFCVWRTPTGGKLCAINETGTFNSVCSGAKEETGVHMKGDGEVCTLFIDNVDSAVHNGTFICLLNQAETFRPVRKQIDLQVATPTLVNINIKERHQRFYNTSADNVIELVPGETVEFECEGFGGFPSPNIHFIQPPVFQSFEPTWRPLIQPSPITQNQGDDKSNTSNNIFRYTANKDDQDVRLKCVATQKDYDNDILFQSEGLHIQCTAERKYRLYSSASKPSNVSSTGTTTSTRSSTGQSESSLQLDKSIGSSEEQEPATIFSPTFSYTGYQSFNRYDSILDHSTGSYYKPKGLGQFDPSRNVHELTRPSTGVSNHGGTGAINNNQNGVANIGMNIDCAESNKLDTLLGEIDGQVVEGPSFKIRDHYMIRDRKMNISSVDGHINNYYENRNWESGTLDALTLGQMDQVKNTATVFDCQLGCFSPDHALHNQIMVEDKLIEEEENCS